MLHRKPVFPLSAIAVGAAVLGIASLVIPPVPVLVAVALAGAALVTGDWVRRSRVPGSDSPSVDWVPRGPGGEVTHDPREQAVLRRYEAAAPADLTRMDREAG